MFRGFGILLILSITSISFAAEYIGFLVADESAVITFRNEGSRFYSLTQDELKGMKVKDLGLTIFHAGKELGWISFDSQEDSIRPGMLKKKKFKVDEKKLRELEKSKKIDFAWGMLDDVSNKNRPVLLSTLQSMKDPENWKTIKPDDIPSEIKKKIISEVLDSRRIQECTQENSKTKKITVTEKYLKFGTVFRNSQKDKYIVPIDFEEVPALEACTGNAFNIHSALVTVNGTAVVDLLKDNNWNYRHLDVLEAVDLNNDGQSEIVFMDFEYNYDGFSIFDFRSKKLTKFGSASH